VAKAAAAVKADATEKDTAMANAAANTKGTTTMASAAASTKDTTTAKDAAEADTAINLFNYSNFKIGRFAALDFSHPTFKANTP